MVWPQSARRRQLMFALACVSRRGKGVPGQAAPLRFSGRRCAPTALRCSVSWPVAKLTALTAFAAFKQTATSQLTKRAARAGHEPCAARRLRGAAQPTRARLCRNVACLGEKHQRCLSGRWHPAGAISVATRSAGPRSARASALRQLTRGVCLNAANAVSAVSLAARPRTEHRSAVGAKRRPPQHEPPPGAARRDALTSAQGGRPRTAATGRYRSSRHRRSRPRRHPEALQSPAWR